MGIAYYDSQLRYSLFHLVRQSVHSIFSISITIVIWIYSAGWYILPLPVHYSCCRALIWPLKRAAFDLFTQRDIMLFVVAGQRGRFHIFYQIYHSYDKSQSHFKYMTHVIFESVSLKSLWQLAMCTVDDWAAVVQRCKQAVLHSDCSGAKLQINGSFPGWSPSNHQLITRDELPSCGDGHSKTKYMSRMPHHACVRTK